MPEKILEDGYTAKDIIEHMFIKTSSDFKSYTINNETLCRLYTLFQRHLDKVERFLLYMGNDSKAQAYDELLGEQEASGNVDPEPKEPLKDARPTCEDCVYSYKFSDTEAYDCHRYPPTPKGAWRSVLAHEWCGEYKSR